MGRKPIGRTAQKNLPAKERNSRSFAFRIRNNAGHMESIVRQTMDEIYDDPDIDTANWMVQTVYKGLKSGVETESEIIDDLLSIRQDMIVIRDEMANQIDRLVAIASGPGFFTHHEPINPVDAELHDNLMSMANIGRKSSE